MSPLLFNVSKSYIYLKKKKEKKLILYSVQEAKSWCPLDSDIKSNG